MSSGQSDQLEMRPIDARTVSDQVTSELRRLIVSGGLPPGQTLSLRKLADGLGVSFIPVRDALKVLRAEGLVVDSPGRSAAVAPLDLAELSAMYRLRRMLEPDLARRSVLDLTSAELDRLEQVAVGLGDSGRTMEDIYDDHRAFHLALISPATSAWDERILMLLWQASERYVRIAFGLLDPDPREHERRRQAHVLLVDEFRARDPERAAAALDGHLAHNEEIAREALAAHRVSGRKL